MLIFSFFVVIKKPYFHIPVVEIPVQFSR